jgi:F0F1-type ATP synthase membrane subunit b/b'
MLEMCLGSIAFTLFAIIAIAVIIKSIDKWMDSRNNNDDDPYSC